MRSGKLILASLVLFLAACAGATRGSGGSDYNTLTREELSRSNASDLYRAIQMLRGDWLTGRGPTSVTNASPTVPTVYMNNTRVGGLDFLQTVNLADVGEVRFWTANRASAQFGMNNPGGVIQIIPRGSQTPM